MSGFTEAWLIWIVFFFAIEGDALFSKEPHSNTLSAHLWQWASMSGKSRWWLLRRAALFGSLIWLFIHLAFHWSRFLGWL